MEGLKLAHSGCMLRAVRLATTAGLAALSLTVLLRGVRRASPTHSREMNPCGYDFQVGVVPSPATQDNTITVTYSAFWADSCVPHHQSHQVVSDVIRMDAVWNRPPPNLRCAQAITPWGGSADVGKLLSGTHRVDAYITYVSTSTASPPALCGSKTFRVYERLLVYLPLVLKNSRTWDADYEENDHWLAAYGPLASGRAYQAYPDDTEDYYYFALSAQATVNVSVTDYAPTSSNGTVALYGPAVGDERGPQIEYYGPQGDSSMHLGPHSLGPGRYYVRVYTAQSYSTTQRYTLVVTY